MPLNVVFLRPQIWSRLKPYYWSTIKEILTGRHGAFRTKRANCFARIGHISEVKFLPQVFFGNPRFCSLWFLNGGSSFLRRSNQMPPAFLRPHSLQPLFLSLLTLTEPMFRRESNHSLETIVHRSMVNYLWFLPAFESFRYYSCNSF